MKLDKPPNGQSLLKTSYPHTNKTIISSNNPQNDDTRGEFTDADIKGIASNGNTDTEACYSLFTFTPDRSVSFFFFVGHFCVLLRAAGIESFEGEQS